MDDQKLGLTVFLLKSGQLDNLRKAFLADQNSFDLLPPLQGFFIPIPADQRPPTWVDAVRSILQNANTPTLLGQSPAGVLIVTRGSRVFAITFGHAWRQLKDEWLEIDFGRKVALNSVPREQLLEIRAEQVFAKWHISNERAPRASSVDEFGVEFDRDLVAVVEGVPSEGAAKKLGSTDARNVIFGGNHSKFELMKVFHKYHKTVHASWLDSRPRNGSWHLCLVSLGRDAIQLPFFARRSLVRAYKDLAERGHSVAFTAA